jgi:glycosyltransferase involved in cell wall biosynthesis
MHPEGRSSDLSLSVSVCMATYNGAKYIEEQARSILVQLNAGDELVIVDDGSNDDTISIVEALRDPRISIHRNDRNRGHVYSFQAAIRYSKNPFILLADQDDRWLPNRVDALLSSLLSTRAMVTTSNMDYMDSDGNRVAGNVHRVTREESHRCVSNIVRIFAGRSGYFGCAMAFRRELLPIVLPIPEFVESHDLWIALASNLFGTNVHIPDNTVIRRLHSSNASHRKRSLYQKLKSRLVFLRCITWLVLRRFQCNPLTFGTAGE